MSDLSKGEVKRGHGSTYSAAQYLLDFIKDSVQILGYRGSLKITQELGDEGASGHAVRIVAPRGGFSEFQREKIEAYARSLVAWKNMHLEVRWTEEEGVLSFAAETDEAAEARGFRDWFRGRPYLAAKRMSATLTDQGFMVREPTQATMLTLKKQYSGMALVLKYPGSRKEDDAGVNAAYDDWVPMLADVFARDHSLKSDMLKEGELVTAFFTRDRTFQPSLYQTTPMFRILVPRRRSVHHIALRPATYRACMALSRQYRQYFDIIRRPVPSWTVRGHALVLQYKKGAGGKVIDDSYIRSVGLFSQKIMRKYHCQCYIQRDATERALVVTYYYEVDDWRGGKPSDVGMPAIG